MRPRQGRAAMLSKLLQHASLRSQLARAAGATGSASASGSLPALRVRAPQLSTGTDWLRPRQEPLPVSQLEDDSEVELGPMKRSRVDSGSQ